MRIARNQTAVYWAPTGRNYAGLTTFGTPVEIACRWEERNEIYISSNAQEERSSAVVYPESQVVNEGLLFLGTLNDLSSGQEADPRSITGIQEIKAVQNSINVKATETVYKVWV